MTVNFTVIYTYYGDLVCLLRLWRENHSEILLYMSLKIQFFKVLLSWSEINHFQFIFLSIFFGGKITIKLFVSHSGDIIIICCLLPVLNIFDINIKKYQTSTEQHNFGDSKSTLSIWQPPLFKILWSVKKTLLKMSWLQVKIHIFTGNINSIWKTRVYVEK